MDFQTINIINTQICIFITTYPPSEYNIVNSAKTQCQCQNRLFLANTTEEVVPIKELSDLSLRIYPFASQNKNIGCVNSEYQDLSDSDSKFEYYNAFNVYNYLGYWNENWEMARMSYSRLSQNSKLKTQN